MSSLIYPKPLVFFHCSFGWMSSNHPWIWEKTFPHGPDKKKHLPHPTTTTPPRYFNLSWKVPKTFVGTYGKSSLVPAWKLSFFFFGKEMHHRNLTYQKWAYVKPESPFPDHDFGYSCIHIYMYIYIYISMLVFGDVHLQMGLFSIAILLWIHLESGFESRRHSSTGKPHGPCASPLKSYLGVPGS